MTLSVTLSCCVCVHRISLGGEGNALYPVLFSYSSCYFLLASQVTGCPLFSNIDFPRLFHDQTMKIHDLLAQQIFQSKRYTTFECISELVCDSSSCSKYQRQKDKTTCLFTHNYITLPSFSMTFHDLCYFSGLENGLPKFHDFP